MNFILPSQDDSIITAPADRAGSHAGFRIVFAEFALKVATDNPQFPFASEQRDEASSWRHADMLEWAILQNLVLRFRGVDQEDGLIHGKQDLHRA